MECLNISHIDVVIIVINIYKFIQVSKECSKNVKTAHKKWILLDLFLKNVDFASFNRKKIWHWLFCHEVIACRFIDQFWEEVDLSL